MNFQRKNQTFARLENHHGFTLIEIMIVMTLLGLILTFAVGNFMAKRDEGYKRGAKILIRQLQTALDDYNRTCNSYPTNAQGGLNALIEKPSDNSCKDYDPSGYVKDRKLPKDPWGNDFVYICEDGRKYVLKSLGQDKKEGGEKNDKDISSDDQDF